MLIQWQINKQLYRNVKIHHPVNTIYVALWLKYCLKYFRHGQYFTKSTNGLANNLSSPELALKNIYLPLPERFSWLFKKLKLMRFAFGIFWDPMKSILLWCGLSLKVLLPDIEKTDWSNMVALGGGEGTIMGLLVPFNKSARVTLHIHIYNTH